MTLVFYFFYNIFLINEKLTIWEYDDEVVLGNNFNV